MCGGGGKVKTFLSINEKKFTTKSKEKKLIEICVACHHSYGKHFVKFAICPDQIIKTKNGINK